jgi:hypothetical protein
MVRGVPVFGSRRRGVFSRMTRRVVTLLFVSAAVAGVLFLAHLSRVPNAHQADDQEEQCRIIQESGEEYAGQLSACQAKVARLRLMERAR